MGGEDNDRQRQMKDILGVLEHYQLATARPNMHFQPVRAEHDTRSLQEEETLLFESNDPPIFHHMHNPLPQRQPQPQPHDSPPHCEAMSPIRRKQERHDKKLALLERQAQDAWEEADEAREMARSWSRKMRMVVTKWLHEDRVRMRQKGTEGVSTEQTYQAAIVQLEQKVQQLEQHNQESLERYLSGETTLHQIIQKQQARIEELQHELMVHSDRVVPDSEGVPEQNAEERINDSLHEAQQPHQQHEETVEHQEEEHKEEEQSSLEEVVQKHISTTNSHEEVTESCNSHCYNETTTPRGLSAFEIAKALAMTPGEQSVPISPDDSSSAESSREYASREGDDSTQSEFAPRHLSSSTSQSPSRLDPPQQPLSTHSPKPRRRVRLLSPKGHPIIRYKNGAIKEIRSDGTIIVRFANGDIQSTMGETVAYYYSKTQALSASQPDGSTLWEFPNGQLEQHWPNGKRQVVDPGHSPNLFRLQDQNHAVQTVKEEARISQLDQLAVD